MAKNDKTTYYIGYEYDYDYKGDYTTIVIREKTFLWKKKIVASGFKDFKEAAEYVKNNLHGQLTKRQEKKIYG